MMLGLQVITTIFPGTIWLIDCRRAPLMRLLIKFRTTAFLLTFLPIEIPKQVAARFRGWAAGPFKERGLAKTVTDKCIPVRRRPF